MPLKSTKSTKLETFEFIMSHDDVLDMINDPHVEFEEIGCNETSPVRANWNEEFEIIVRKPGGAEYRAPFKLSRSDELVVRFMKKRQNSAVQPLGDIDVDKCYNNICEIPDAVKAVAESVLMCDGTRLLMNIPTTTPSPQPTNTPTTTLNFCVTPTASPTPSPTPSSTPTGTPTSTPTPTPSPTPNAYFDEQPFSISAKAGSDVTFSYRLRLENSIFNSPQAVWQYKAPGASVWQNMNQGATTSTTPGVIDGYLVLNDITGFLNYFSYRVVCSDEREGYYVVSNEVNLIVDCSDWPYIIAPFSDGYDCSYVATRYSNGCWQTLDNGCYGPGYATGNTKTANYCVPCSSSSSSSSSSECPYIECGGTVAFADCSPEILPPPPGYITTIDCHQCKCVIIPEPTPTPTDFICPVPTSTPTCTATDFFCPAPTPTPKVVYQDCNNGGVPDNGCFSNWEQFNCGCVFDYTASIISVDTGSTWQAFNVTYNNPYSLDSNCDEGNCYMKIIRGANSLNYPGASLDDWRIGEQVHITAFIGATDLSTIAYVCAKTKTGEYDTLILRCTPVFEPTPTPVQQSNLWSWGSNEQGQLGKGSISSFENTPTNIGLENTWMGIVVGGLQSAAASNENYYSWGSNYFGNLGNGTKENVVLFPTLTQEEQEEPYEGAWNWTDIAFGNGFGVGINIHGEIYSWGKNDIACLGDGTHEHKLLPVKVGEETNWVKVSAGESHILALNSLGEIYAWGHNHYGQLGIGSNDTASIPTKVSGEHWTYEHPWTLTMNSGEMISITSPSNGLLVANVNSVQSIKSQEENLIGILSINGIEVVGLDGEFEALVAEGDIISLSVQGSNNLSKLIWSLFVQEAMSGSSSSSSSSGSSYPTSWVEISAGDSHSLAIRSDGTLWSWGFNQDGRLGLGTTVEANAPSKVGLNNNWNKISAGGDFSMALNDNSEIYSWGKNLYGQLGDETNINKYEPVRVGAENNWTNITAGSSFALAINDIGELYSWGLNQKGQLGDGSNENKNSPNRVGYNTYWTDVKANHSNHVLALGVLNSTSTPTPTPTIEIGTEESPWSFNLSAGESESFENSESGVLYGEINISDLPVSMLSDLEGVCLVNGQEVFRSAVNSQFSISIEAESEIVVKAEGTSLSKTVQWTLYVDSDTPEPTPEPTPDLISWILQPTDANYIYENDFSGEATFSYEYTKPSSVVAQPGEFPSWQYSDDEGSTWTDINFETCPSCLVTAASSTNGEIDNVSSNLNVSQIFPGRIYRGKVVISGFVYYTDTATLNFPDCGASECVPDDYEGPVYVADCGLAITPGYTSYMRCDLCRCVRKAMGSEFIWLLEPGGQPYSLGQIQFSFEYEYPSALASTGPIWQFSDDNGETWTNVGEEQADGVQVFSGGTEGTTYVSGNLTITNPGTYSENRKYRVKTVVDGQEYYSFDARVWPSS